MTVRSLCRRCRNAVRDARCAVAALLLVLLVGTPAYAHGGATVTIHSDGLGSVWITAMWQDGHPINEPTTATLTAASAAASVAPVTLRQTGDERGTQTYSGTLAPGSWRVAVDLGAPVNGHCQAVIQSAPSSPSPPAPVEVACLIPASAAAPAPSAGASVWYTVGFLGVFGTCVLMWWAWRRRRG